MVMNEAFFRRAKADIERSILTQANPREYFDLTFASNVALMNKFFDICKAGPKVPFLEMVQRESRVKKWVDFLKHEQTRAHSKWNSSQLSGLPDRITSWFDSLQAPDLANCLDLIVRMVSIEIIAKLTSVVPDACLNLEPPERIRLGLRAFRTMTWRLRSGVL
ncbi:MAG: hypothetical protein HQK55_05570 [Deltaproteobacteria bacterium]|nr:hypothetical protein [Deltaproteobacteria bacterium]